jgi:ribosomal protein S7
MLIKIKKGKYILGLKDKEFEFFLNKFYGSLIFRGRRSFAIKLFDIILFNFKKLFNGDPFVSLRKSIDNLIPILGLTQRKIGKVYHAVPKLAVGNRRFVVMLN